MSSQPAAPVRHRHVSDPLERGEVVVVIAEDVAPPADPSTRVWLGGAPAQTLPAQTLPAQTLSARPAEPTAVTAVTAAPLRSRRDLRERGAARDRSPVPGDTRPPRRAAARRADVLRVGLTAERLRLTVMVVIGLATTIVLFGALIAA
jgi:hypothetical protein